MNLFESEKEKFNEQWWKLLGHHFKESYMQKVYTQIKLDASRKGYKVLPSSEDIYKPFKLINPDDVRVVFLTCKPICIYEQSLIWQKLNRQIEIECYDNLHLNIEDNLNYVLKNGIINLSPQLTICNKSEHQDIGWGNFVLNVINILQQTGNKVLFVIEKEEFLNNFISKINFNDNIIYIENGCFTKINKFLKVEYNEYVIW